MGDLLVKVMSSLSEQDNVVLETKLTVERTERMYVYIKEDFIRHEALFFEMARKSEQNTKTSLDFFDKIEALQKYTLMNDLHLEAFLPLQTASIAFEVGKGLASKDKMHRYEKHVAEKVIKTLDESCLSVIESTLG